MGRWNVTLELANYDDLAMVHRGMLAPGQVRRLSLAGVVDSAVAKLVLPPPVVQRLGLQLADHVTVRYADGRAAHGRQVENVSLELVGRRGTYTAVVAPSRQTVVVGFIVLQDLDLIIDRELQQIIPRDPRGKIHEIE